MFSPLLSSTTTLLYQFHREHILHLSPKLGRINHANKIDLRTLNDPPRPAFMRTHSSSLRSCVSYSLSFTL